MFQTGLNDQLDFKVAELSPKNIFGNYPPQMVPQDLKIPVTSGFGDFRAKSTTLDFCFWWLSLPNISPVETESSPSCEVRLQAIQSLTDEAAEEVQEIVIKMDPRTSKNGAHNSTYRGEHTIVLCIYIYGYIYI